MCVSLGIIDKIFNSQDKYSEIWLDPGKFVVLPAGSRKVTAFSVKAKLNEGDQMEVVTNLFEEDLKENRKSITESGKSVEFPRPSVAVTPERLKFLRDDAILAPGALAPVEDKKKDKKE